MASPFEEWLLKRQQEQEEAERERAGLPSLGDVLSPAATAEKPGFWAGQGEKFMEEVNKPTSLEYQTPITSSTLPDLYEGAKAGIIRQLGKTPWEFAKDVATAPISLVRSGIAHGAATLKTFAEDPLEMIPVGLETAAGVGARLYPPTSAFALPIAAVARGLGEVVLGGIKGKNPWTIENAAEVAFAPVRSLMGAGMATEGVKLAAREAVKTGATEGLGARAAKFLDLNKLTPRLADTTVKTLESQVTPWQQEQLVVQHALNQADLERARERKYNGMTTKQMEAALNRVDAADQVINRDPSLYEGDAPGVLNKQVRDELERRGMLQQYLKNKEQRFDLEDLATLQDGKLPLHMLPVKREVREKAANDEAFHRQLTSDVLEDLANHEDPRKPKAMERKFGGVDFEAAKATWEQEQQLAQEMGTPIPAYKMDPDTGKLSPINTGDMIKNEVERAMNQIKRREFEPTQIAEVTTQTPLTEADAASMLGVMGPDVLPRLMKELESVPNEKLAALKAEMLNNRKADRTARTSRRADPNYGDQEVHNILMNYEKFMDDAASGSRETGLAQAGTQAKNVVIDAAQRDARNVLLEEMKEAGMKQWERNNNIRSNYEAELKRTMPEVADKALDTGFSNLMDDIHAMNIGAHYVADEALVDGQKQAMSQLGRLGLTASVVDPQHTLQNKLNDVNMARIGSLLSTGGIVKKNAVYAFGTAGDAVFKKHGVNKEWADHFMQSRKHKEFFGAAMDAVKGLATPAEREAALRDLWQQDIPTARGSMGPPATKPKFDEEDLPMWAKMADFGNEFMEKVRDPEYATLKAITKDPKKLPVYQRGLLFPTTIAESELGELNDHIARVTASMERRAKKGETPDNSSGFARDAEVLELMNRKKLVLDEHMGDVGKAISQLTEAFDTHGITKGRVHSASMKEKFGDMVYGTDPYKSWRTGMERNVGKAVYDVVLPAAEANLAKFMERRGTSDKTRAIEKFVQNLLLDQVGTRKTIQYDKLTTRLNAAGIPVKAETIKKTVGLINTARYVMDIALNARFYPAQLTQNALMLGGLVGGENFVHGLGKVMPWNWKESSKEAHAVGAISDEMDKLFLEDTPDKIAQKLEPLSKLVKFSEKVNRTWAYHAGKKNGLDNGLSEQQAIRHGINVVRDTNFFQDPANRAPATNTPLGSTLMRYRSFSHMYATFLSGQIRKKNWDTVGDSLGVLMSLSGTYGIPFYSMVQSALAQQGVNLPTIAPVDEMTGTGIGGGMAALPGMPTTWKSVFGTVLAPGVELFEKGIGEEGIAGAAQALVGRPISQIAAAVAEIARKGRTKTPSGEKKITRSPEQVFFSALNMAPTAQNQVRATRAEVTRMKQAGDNKAITAYFKKERERGNRYNKAAMLSQIKSSLKRDKNQSLADLLFQQ